MHEFLVPDITCNHCVSTITKALRAEDPQARVDVALDQRLVNVESSLSTDEIAACITDAGYTPTAVSAGRAIT